jgi:hypothetical protein
MSTLTVYPPSCHQSFTTSLLSVWQYSMAPPDILPMRKRHRPQSTSPPSGRPSVSPAYKKLRSHSLPQSVIPLRRAPVILLQPGPPNASRRPTVIAARPLRIASRSLHRAAILNRARLRGWKVPSPGLSGARTENINLEDSRGEADELAARRVQTSRPPLPPSPLGLSNYEELDQWHGYHDQFDEGDPGGVYSTQDGEDGEFYSDFNFLDPDAGASEEAADEDYDTPFAVLPTELPKQSKPSDDENATGEQSKNCNPNWCSSPKNDEVYCGG